MICRYNPVTRFELRSEDGKLYLVEKMFCATYLRVKDYCPKSCPKRVKVVMEALIHDKLWWICPFCRKRPFRTLSFENYYKHLASYHRRHDICDLLIRHFSRDGTPCVMVAMNSQEYSVHDFLFELVERPKMDKESVFGSDRFLEWYWGVGYDKPHGKHRLPTSARGN